MKTIEVVAAIIRREDSVFATQRGYGDWKDYWEYPGGKVEPGETPEAALVREIREELDTDIRVDKFLTTIEWDYPAFHLTMHCYMCSLLTEALHLNEHEDARWLSAGTLGSVNWLPADYQLIPLIEKELQSGTAKKPMTADEFETMWKESSFREFERNADCINHPLTEEEQKQVAEASERVDRWTQEWFDDDKDPDDDGTTDPAEFARLERELAALRLRLEQKQLSEADYNAAKMPILEAMYSLLKPE